jgi:hypothetical protein
VAPLGSVFKPPSAIADIGSMRLHERAQTDEAIERIDQLLANARPVPLTDQIRLNLKEAQALLDEVRVALAAERRGS